MANPKWAWTTLAITCTKSGLESHSSTRLPSYRQRADRALLLGLDLDGRFRTGLAWFVIVGFNMLAQVGWSIPQFIRQLFWLALEPPSPEYGLTMPPLNDGGWYIIASFFLLVSVMTWLLRAYLLAEQHRWGNISSGALRLRSGCSSCWACSVDPDGVLV